MNNLRIIRDNVGINELKSYLKDKEFVVLDTETTGLTEEAIVVGYSICAEPDLAFYVVTNYWDKEKQELLQLETCATARQVMSILKNKKLIGHNFVFDAAMVERNYRVDIIGSCYCDTMVLAHLLDENRPKGLKELGEIFYGNSATEEQKAMQASVVTNGGVLKKDNYEMYKADSELLGRYGAKDAILTFNLFYELMQDLYDQGLNKFFFDECMPLLRGPTYQLNTVGLKVDMDKLNDLKVVLETELMEAKAFIMKEVQHYIEEEYPGTNKKNIFNLNSGSQISWLLFEKLQNTPGLMTDGGRELCGNLSLKVPYTNSAKLTFINKCKEFKGVKVGKSKIRDWWVYFSVDDSELSTYSDKYKWVEKLREYKKTIKLLNTYVDGIIEKVKYGVIHPNFNQTGTDGTRYSSSKPNFQNLPRKDKRIKECIIARPGKVFIGADYSQLEPRIFAYLSKDEELMLAFQKGQDFYSVMGVKVYNKPECSVYKNDANFFGTMFPNLRDKTKIFALAIVYGKNSKDIAQEMGISIEEAKIIKDAYFAKFPRIELMILEAYEKIKTQGYVTNIFGRKRRVPEALKINKLYPNVEHKDLASKERHLLNLGVNYPIQATAGSIVNRAAISFVEHCPNARIVMQIHDELVVECDEKDALTVSMNLRHCMEGTTQLEGVPLVAEPKISKDLAGLK